jgi:hypothetical protein
VFKPPINNYIRRYGEPADADVTEHARVCAALDVPPTPIPRRATLDQLRTATGISASHLSKITTGRQPPGNLTRDRLVEFFHALWFGESLLYNPRYQGANRQARYDAVIDRLFGPPAPDFPRQLPALVPIAGRVFLTRCTTLEPEAFEPTARLHNAFEQWRPDRGHRLTLTSFGLLLAEIGPPLGMQKLDNRRPKGWSGRRLSSS